jgi:hypothetical protein
MRFTILFLLATSVFAQTANVIELTPADQARTQKAWDALQKAQTEWDSTRKELEQKYILVREDDPDASNERTLINLDSVGTGMVTNTFWSNGTTSICNTIGYQGDCPKPSKEEIEKADKERKAYSEAHERYFRKGFENGVNFSKDFRFIVPKVAEPKTNTWPNTYGFYPERYLYQLDGNVICASGRVC